MTAMTAERRQVLYEFINACELGVIATANPGGPPECALVNIAVTPELEIVFETTDATRKWTNIRRDPQVSFVIGWKDVRTLQMTGVADEPIGNEYIALKDLYYGKFPEKKRDQFWPGLTIFRVRPYWIRFSSYFRPRSIEEIAFTHPELPTASVRKGWARRFVGYLSK